MHAPYGPYMFHAPLHRKQAGPRGFADIHVGSLFLLQQHFDVGLLVPVLPSRVLDLELAECFAHSVVPCIGKVRLKYSKKFEFE